jgi:hypothetical protein
MGRMGTEMSERARQLREDLGMLEGAVRLLEDDVQTGRISWAWYQQGAERLCRRMAELEAKLDELA